ncbi:MAG TPA: tRNA 4-thiouridine(8) synthase ThiI [Clostridiaceae bacterium]|nr:tRNA 4-thiouridine(8) synthase ThiI [Clostridiaceae bacterium]
MKKIILVRYGEIILKGLNRPSFESALVKNIKRTLYGLGEMKVEKSQARIFIEPMSDEFDFDGAVEKLTRVFGIVSLSIVWKIETDFEVIKEYSLRVVNELVGETGYSTFKVMAKRGNKRFPIQSPEIGAKIGAHILSSIPGLSVDLYNPQFTLFIEVREHTYIYSEIIPAQGGLPTGTSGKALLLLSGGIDSPVAGWMMGKRGLEIDAIHFYSYPYTSERAKEKVIELARILSTYCFDIHLHIVPFTAIQEEINFNAPHNQMTIIMRRAMMKIAEAIAKNTGSLALITGESLGQVASQTIQGLAVTNNAVSMPVFRPLIGMDKNEVVALARKINTYETSILPYEDCCTTFVAKHPDTRPQLDKILKLEKELQLDNLIEEAVKNTEIIILTRGKVIEK